MKTNIFKNIKVVSIIAVASIVSVSPILLAGTSYASPIMNRKLALSNSVGDASGVTYSFSTTTALPTTTNAIKSVEIKFCTSLSDSCASTPSGFTSTSSSLASQPSGLGAASGWTVDTSAAGSLRIVNASNSTNPSGNVSISWNGVHNPTATNTSFYAMVTTYSGSAFTGALDTGSIALSTTSAIQVNFTVNETLMFCTGTSITGQNCGTATGGVVSLGTGSTLTTSTGTSIMAASTNGSTGYSISMNGSTLTSGSNTITALASNAASSIGNKQFGVNLMSNTTPTVGSAVNGTGTGTPAANYNSSNSFRFVTGETVASAAGPSNANTYTVSYIANIDGVTPAGVYSTNLDYIATANF
jgi:hypothetical protein